MAVNRLFLDSVFNEWLRAAGNPCFLNFYVNNRQNPNAKPGHKQERATRSTVDKISPNQSFNTIGYRLVGNAVLRHEIVRNEARILLSHGVVGCDSGWCRRRVGWWRSFRLRCVAVKAKTLLKGFVNKFCRFSSKTKLTFSSIPNFSARSLTRLQISSLDSFLMSGRSARFQ